MEVVGKWYGRLRAWRGDGAEAGDGERRVVGGALAFAAHVVWSRGLSRGMRDVRQRLLGGGLA
jgi:hypothetical protein